MPKPNPSPSAPPEIMTIRMASVAAAVTAPDTVRKNASLLRWDTSAVHAAKVAHTRLPPMARL